MYKRYLRLTLLFSAGLLLAQASTASAEETIAAGELVFADCEEYVNIRSEASEDSEVIAKLYNHHAATIVEAEEDGWYEITSGNVTGYIKGEYLASGEEAEAIAEEVAYNVAIVNAAALNVRTQPSEDSDILDVAEESEELEVVNYDGGWMTVALGNDLYGYVSPDYCEYKTYYPIAVTLEEEAAAEVEAEAAAQAEAEASSKDTDSSDASYTDTSYTDSSADASYTDTSSDSSYTDTSADSSYTDTSSDASYTDSSADSSYTDTSSDSSYTDTSADSSYTDTSSDSSYTDTSADSSYTDTSSDSSYTDTSADSSYTDTSSDSSYTDTSADTTASETSSDTTDSSTSSDSSLGQQIADYAVQFVGNPYVYGGTSLTNGTDCSGFTQSVMAQFGISLPRTAADQAYSGTSISVSEVQAGDLLFYSDGSGISHVALYIGGGQIVHASTEETGIIISSAYYSTPVCAARYW